MKRKGNFWIRGGVLCLLLALGLVVWNGIENQTACKQSKEVLQKLEEYSVTNMPLMEYHPSGDKYHTDMEMPVAIIEGEEYIGSLEMPSLKLRLPVMSQWSYLKLRTAPCRYSGTAYNNNLILMAHNYIAHFGALYNLQIGSEIVFTDIDGNVFSYRVIQKEVVKYDDVESMKSGEWDLTLFTCTISGQERVTVRCKREGTS